MKVRIIIILRLGEAETKLRLGAGTKQSLLTGISLRETRISSL